MSGTRQYPKVIRWSAEDACYVGTSPGLMLGGVHGHDERQVFDDLCRAVEEIVALYDLDGKPLPKPEPPPSG